MDNTKTLTKLQAFFTSIAKFSEHPPTGSTLILGAISLLGKQFSKPDTVCNN
ncbi:hypothetical protein AO385_0963 [Moraxella catarrhalis]|uniref:Uncharacterized protein n=1 Tax=Moraxella catarrhalis TaxID=480 RepID=A0A198UMH6_MORCA|nr:hypothetical protein AO383_1614 [Moraxella catarrhalis]OAU97693.1 hypothetical protein AO384_0379 [Moraxella catarrhalis]OAV02561.1 hypothetical protein AO385_0963 [Moraxella catarrhalis]